MLAYLYADALAGRGYPVRVLPGLGTRELVDPALMTGLLQLVPEYTGSALEFVSLGRVHATASVAATAAALARQVDRPVTGVTLPAPWGALCVAACQQMPRPASWPTRKATRRPAEVKYRPTCSHGFRRLDGPIPSPQGHWPAEEKRWAD